MVAVGDGDLLGRAALLAWRAGARRDQDLAAALELATAGGAGVLGLDGHGLEPGCWADLALVPASTVGEAVVAHPPRLPGAQAGPGGRPGLTADAEPLSPRGGCDELPAGPQRPCFRYRSAMLVGVGVALVVVVAGGGHPWGLTQRRTREPLGA